MAKLKDTFTVGELLRAICTTNDGSQVEINDLIRGYSKRIRQALEGVLEWCLITDGVLSPSSLGMLVGEFAKQQHLMPSEVMSFQLHEFAEILYVNSGGKYDRWELDSSESETGGVATNEASNTAERTLTASSSNGMQDGGDGKLPKLKKTGHRRTTEELFKAALRAHHKYEPGGSVLNVEPASTRQIEIITEKGISDSTARRLLERHFGSVEKYQEACFSGAIGPKLVILLGDALHAFGSFDHSNGDVEDAADDSEE